MSEPLDGANPPVSDSPEPRKLVPGELVARAGRYYRNTRYLIVVMLIGYGAWSIYDGFVAWPKINRDIARADQDFRAAELRGDEPAKNAATTEKLRLGTPKSDSSIFLNRLLGVLLPPLGVFMLFYSLHNSRGEIRMTEDDTLHAPGHPPVPPDAMTALDKRLWDRKGIAFVEYTLPDGKTGRIRLDDFVYERPPIDAMYDRIHARFASEAPAADVAQS